MDDGQLRRGVRGEYSGNQKNKTNLNKRTKKLKMKLCFMYDKYEMLKGNTVRKV